MADSEALHAFLNTWQEDPLHAKKAFQTYMDMLTGQKGVSLSFKARPGISYSLRARHAAQGKRELFVLVDVVDDEPEARWLSVCFYDDMVADPEELGDFVPEGLMGENARCFNLEEDDSRMRDYIGARLAEAVRAAAGTL
ncbi:MAG: hypothetical protein IJU65_07625 [Desulfovibrio sp.]|nr:hypothetical protein [Desulfovibrio sp.]